MSPEKKNIQSSSEEIDYVKMFQGVIGHKGNHARNFVFPNGEVVAANEVSTRDYNNQDLIRFVQGEH